MAFKILILKRADLELEEAILYYENLQIRFRQKIPFVL